MWLQKHRFYFTYKVLWCIFYPSCIFQAPLWHFRGHQSCGWKVASYEVSVHRQSVLTKWMLIAAELKTRPWRQYLLFRNCSGLPVMSLTPPLTRSAGSFVLRGLSNGAVPQTVSGAASNPAQRRIRQPQVVYPQHPQVLRPTARHEGGRRTEVRQPVWLLSETFWLFSALLWTQYIQVSMDGWIYLSSIVSIQHTQSQSICPKYLSIHPAVVSIFTFIVVFFICFLELPFIPDSHCMTVDVFSTSHPVCRPACLSVYPGS